jgi:hypothetical protein
LRLWEPLKPLATALLTQPLIQVIEGLIAASDALKRPHTAFGEIPPINRESRTMVPGRPKQKSRKSGPLANNLSSDIVLNPGVMGGGASRCR